MDNWIKTIYVPIRYFRIFIGFPVSSASQIGLVPRRHLAQWRRNIVVIRGTDLDGIGASATCSLGQRFRAERATNREQRQKKAEQA
ncbi:MAG: hypothetical protein DMG97_43170 [Acidobacteria bacterium]|nr:MAG: hypothetical protein DMG97_43170 [Acidobacteriota bacterium]